LVCSAIVIPYFYQATKVQNKINRKKEKCLFLLLFARLFVTLNFGLSYFRSEKQKKNMFSFCFSLAYS